MKSSYDKRSVEFYGNEEETAAAASTRRREARAERREQRARAREEALAAALVAGDQEAVATIEKKIRAAALAPKAKTAEEKAVRHAQMPILSQKRDEAAWAVAAPVRMVVGNDHQCSRLGWYNDLAGLREEAQLVAASPRIQAISDKLSDLERSADARDYLIRRAESVSDDRRRPLRSAVLVLPEATNPDFADDFATARSLLYLTVSGVDVDSDDWVLIRHDGSTGKGQGYHYHLVHVDLTGTKPGGHAEAAVAARIWAAACGDPEAAQAPSLSTGYAAKRGWARFDDIRTNLEGQQLTVPEEAAAIDAGGLWLCKTGHRASLAKFAMWHFFGSD